MHYSVAVRALEVCVDLSRNSIEESEITHGMSSSADLEHGTEAIKNKSIHATYVHDSQYKFMSCLAGR